MMSEILDLTAFRQDIPYVSRCLHYFAPASINFQYHWLHLIHALFPDMEDEELWHPPDFFNEEEELCPLEVIQSQANNNNVTFIRANQIALIEERGMITTSLQTKEKACDIEPMVRNELSQTDILDFKEEEVQTEVIHMNSLSHVSALVLPTIQVQIEEGTLDFLVDTGSSVSIVKQAIKPVDTTRKPILQAVNGTYVNVQGMVTLNVILQGHAYPHEFIVADVLHNIIGYDFWAAYQMYLRPTYQGVEVFASDMTPLLQIQNRLRQPGGVYKAMVNAIFPAKEGDTLGNLKNYCEFQQWNEEERPAEDITITVPHATLNPPMEIVAQIEYTKDEVTGLPLYRPNQIHRDPMALACAVIKDENQAEQEKYICSRHLDNVIQDVDEKHLAMVKKDIEEKSVQFIEFLKEEYAPCFREEVDFKDKAWLVSLTR